MARRRPVGIMGRQPHGALDVGQDARKDEAGMEGVTDAEQFWTNLLKVRRDHDHDVMCLMGDLVFGWNVEDAERAYAEQCGREPLTKLEKQQAWFNHVIERGTAAIEAANRAMDGVTGG